MNCNKPVFFLLFTNFSMNRSNISKTICCSISCKPVSVLVSGGPVKSFIVMRKSFENSNFIKAKTFNSGSYCSTVCTERSVNNISFAVRKSVVSCRIACPVEFDIVVQTVNINLTTVSLYKYVIALLLLSILI